MKTRETKVGQRFRYQGMVFERVSEEIVYNDRVEVRCLLTRPSAHRWSDGAGWHKGMFSTLPADAEVQCT